MATYLVVCPAWIENFQDVPVAQPDTTSAPVTVMDGELNGLAEGLRGLFVIGEFASPGAARDAFKARANAELDLAVVDVDNNSHTLAITYEKSRPTGQLWKTSVGLDYIHGLVTDTGGLPAEPYESDGMEGSNLLFAPLVVLRPGLIPLA